MNKAWITRGACACLAGALANPAVAGADTGIFGSGSILVAAKGDDLPLSRDALFDAPPPPAKSAPSGKAKKPAKEPASRDALFELDEPAPTAPAKTPVAETPVKPAPASATPQPAPAAASAPPEPAPASKDALFDLPPASTPPAPAAASAPVPTVPAPVATPTTQPEVTPVAVAVPTPPTAPAKTADAGQDIRGFFQAEAAHANSSTTHGSKALGRLELGTTGRLGDGMQWKLSGRLDFIGQYDHYNGTGQDSPHLEFMARENYLDFSGGGDWEFRLGRQHIVWGELVGMFIADVVSAKDLRDFILPDFQVLRIPQWAARAEYFSGDYHTELIWIPFPSYDRIGKQGADFYPTPPSPAGAPIILTEDKPGAALSNGNFGLRLSRLKDGWDLAGFLYRSTDSQQTFYRDPLILTQFTPRHDRIWQAGGSLAKDLGSFVLKAEAVYTKGRKYNLAGPSFFIDADGLVSQDTLDWAVGLDFNPDADTRFNIQFYQRAFFDHNPDIIPEHFENGYSLLVNRKLPGNWEAEALWVSSFNRSDWMLRPKVTWNFERNWRLVFGLDLFHGPATGIFGQYNKNDRVYSELRYDF